MEEDKEELYLRVVNLLLDYDIVEVCEQLSLACDNLSKLGLGDSQYDDKLKSGIYAFQTAGNEVR